MKAGANSDVRRECAEFLDAASQFYKAPACSIRVLAARPLRVREHWATELFGDYTPETMLIRAWMRTAIRKEVTSFGTFLSALCHEFCHYLDYQKFGFHDSWHTRGFYERAAVLYDYVRWTPPKKLFWVPTSGECWRIDWPRTNRSSCNRSIISTLVRTFAEDWAASEPDQEESPLNLEVARTAKKVAKAVSKNLRVTPVAKGIVRAIGKKAAIKLRPKEVEETVAAALKEVVKDTVKTATREAVQSAVEEAAKIGSSAE